MILCVDSVDIDLIYFQSCCVLLLCFTIVKLSNSIGNFISITRDIIRIELMAEKVLYTTRNIIIMST